MLRSVRSAWGWLVLVVLVASAPRALGWYAASVEAPPLAISNLALLAAMPDDSEGVLIVRREPLAGLCVRVPVSVVTFDALAGRSEQALPESEQRSPYAHVRAALSGSTTWIAQAFSGANFKNPAGLGVGRYDSVQILIASESVKPIRERWEKGEAWPKPSPERADEFAGSPIFRVVHPTLDDAGYRDPQKSTITTFIHFFEDRAVVTASDLDRLKTVLDRLGRPDPTVPERWARALGGLSVESPFLVVRLQPQPSALAEPPAPEIASVAMAVSDPSSDAVAFRVAAAEPVQAVGTLIQDWSLWPAFGYRFDQKPNIEGDQLEDVLRWAPRPMTETPQPADRQRDVETLRLLGVMGWRIAI